MYAATAAVSTESSTTRLSIWPTQAKSTGEKSRLDTPTHPALSASFKETKWSLAEDMTLTCKSVRTTRFLLDEDA
ncbi:hypothetical protein FRB96_006704, partial [Tulasnella sp. 330]